jgi:hypothetical protein
MAWCYGGGRWSTAARPRFTKNDEALAKEWLVMASEVANDEEASRGYLLATVQRIGQGAATEQLATLATFFRRRLDYYVSLVAKYRRAARQPWLSVPSDPPMPEIPTEFVVQ